ncbi:MAG: sialate O-acetylesterase, partial [Thermoguttaceae bacterium]|nr:sialate O-acetylesterase [Thermoguttaceae bacterium]
IWYQGESNANRAWQYRTMFPQLIENWREDWGRGDFPFYFVQLPNYMKMRAEPGESAWAELREAQHKALQMRNVGEAITIDVGDALDVHPTKKREVGERLALLALAKKYGRDAVCSGPEFVSMEISDEKATLTFAESPSPLCVAGTDENKPQKLKGFAIAGSNRKFYWADAEIIGDKVVLSAPEVAKPVAVRYAWADNPDCNLANEAGLPASPFRTDDWPGVTVGVK